MTSQGSAHTRFRRALAAGNPLLVRAAAHELGHVALNDALAVCLVFARSEPAAYEPAALRWLGRLLCEQRALSLADAQAVARELEVLPHSAYHAAACADLARLLAARDLGALAEVLEPAAPSRG